MDTPSWAQFLNSAFPTLSGEGFQIVAQPSDKYNCIAYAVGETGRWWTYLDGYYWPESASRGALVQSLIQAFSELGYELCTNAAQEPGYEKIALYADSAGRWTHAAIQLPGGAWSSKLGPDEDISHQTPESLAGRPVRRSSLHNAPPQAPLKPPASVGILSACMSAIMPPPTTPERMKTWHLWKSVWQALNALLRAWRPRRM